MKDVHSLSHAKWNCKYHVVFAPKYRRKVFCGDKRLEIGAILRQQCEWKGLNIINAERHYVDTVGKNTKAISEYISHQLKEDELGSQLTLEELDPFTGNR